MLSNAKDSGKTNIEWNVEDIAINEEDRVKKREGMALVSKLKWTPKKKEKESWN